MHAIHHTRAVIIKSQALKEADKMYWLFTEDFGLVVAIATGIRKPGAKLASLLLDYAFVEVDLVKGKDMWRLVSALPLCAPLVGHTTHPLARAYVRILATLERFVVGESAHPELFAQIYEAAQMVGGGGRASIDGARHDPAGSYVKRFDTLMIWRILVTLGYIPAELLLQHLYAQPLAEALIHLDDAQTKTLIEEVNMAIKETHL